MTKLTLIKPEVGGKNTTEEPKVGNAFTAIEQVVNGELDSSNIKNESLEEVDFAAAVKTLLAQKVSGLTIRTSTISTTAANGELIEMLTNSGNTVTLPSPTTVGLTVGIITPLVSSKLKTPSGLIIGDGFSAATLTFAAGQHGTVIADGANYFIIAGTPAPVVVGTPGTTGPNIASWGLIGSTGAIEAGSGDYTVSNPSEGKYIVTWKTAKASANYAVVATAASLTGGAGAIPVAVVPTITTKEFVVELYTPAGAHVSDKFSFTAMAGS